MFWVPMLQWKWMHLHTHALKTNKNHVWFSLYRLHNDILSYNKITVVKINIFLNTNNKYSFLNPFTWCENMILFIPVVMHTWTRNQTNKDTHIFNNLFTLVSFSNVKLQNQLQLWLQSTNFIFCRCKCGAKYFLNISRHK